MKRFWRRCLPAIFLFPALTAGAVGLTCAPPSSDWSKWLKQQENKGGHALKCHVGVTAQGLAHRIADSGGNKSGVCLPGSAASSWSSEQSLIAALKEGVKPSYDLLKDDGPGNRVYDGPVKASGTKVGFVVKPAAKGKVDKKCAPGYECKDASRWKLVFKRTDSDCYLLTAYPY